MGFPLYRIFTRKLRGFWLTNAHSEYEAQLAPVAAKERESELGRRGGRQPNNENPKTRLLVFSPSAGSVEPPMGGRESRDVRLAHWPTGITNPRSTASFDGRRSPGDRARAYRLKMVGLDSEASGRGCACANPTPHDGGKALPWGGIEI